MPSFGTKGSQVQILSPRLKRPRLRTGNRRVAAFVFSGSGRLCPECELLCLAKIAFYRELLTVSARTGSLAGLHVSTSLGDHRRTLLGVPVAGRPHDREPRPPPATIHRPAEPSARIGLVDRTFWVVLRRVWARWFDAVVIVTPETVIGWHRTSFALYWRWLSRRRRSSGRAGVLWSPSLCGRRISRCPSRSPRINSRKVPSSPRPSLASKRWPADRVSSRSVPTALESRRRPAGSDFRAVAGVSSSGLV